MSHALYEQQVENPSLEQEKNSVQHDSAIPIAMGSGAGPAPPLIKPDHGDVYSALNAVSNGIHSGDSPFRFKDAIDASQAGIGNRATLAFARQQYQEIHALAQQGFQDTPRAFPFKSQIQQAFGPKHDISNMTAYTGPSARAANAKLDADAYHKGGHVAFGNTPTLEAAAHEAAHYVQNLDATQLQGGVGEADDIYEQQADRVAKAVTTGKSAASLLDQVAPGTASLIPDDADTPLQMTGGRLFRRLGGMGQRVLHARRAMPGQRSISPVVMPSGQDSGEIDYWQNRARIMTERDDSLDPLIMPSGQDSSEIDYAEVLACIADGRSLTPAPIRIAAYILGTAVSRYALGQLTFAATGPWGLGLSPAMSRFFAGAVALGASALLVPRIMPKIEEITRFSYAPNPARGRRPNLIMAAGQGLGAMGLYSALWAMDVPSTEIKELAEGVKKSIPLPYIQNPLWTSLKMITGPLMEVALKQANTGSVGGNALFIRTQNAQDRDDLGTAPPQGSAFANSLGASFMSIGCVGLGALDGKVLGEIMKCYPNDKHNSLGEALACSVIDGSVGGAVEGVVRPGSEWLQRQKWRSPNQWYKDRPGRDDSEISPVLPGYQSGGAFDYWTSLYAREQVPQNNGKSGASSYPRVTRTDKVRENKYGKSPVYNYDDIEFTSAGFNPIENLVGPLPGGEGHRYFAVLRFAQDIEFIQGTMGVHTDISVIDTDEQEQGASMEIMVNTRTETPAPEGLHFFLGNLVGKQYRVQVRDVDYNFTKGVAAVVMPITEEDFYRMRDRMIRSMTPKKPEDGSENFPWWELQAPPGEEHPVNCFNYAGDQARQTELLDPRLNEIFARSRNTNTLREYMAAYLEAFKLGYGRYYNDESSVNRIHIFNTGVEQIFNDWLYRETGDEPVCFLPDPRIYNEQFGGATADITKEFVEWIGTDKAYKVNPAFYAGMPPLTRSQERHPNAYRTSMVDPFKDLAGPLPGPSGHTDFAYTALVQSPTIRDEPSFVAAHSSFGLYKTDRPDKGVWVHLIRDEFETDPYTGEMRDSPSRLFVDQHEDSTWAQGNIMGYLARTFIEEMPAADKLLSGRPAVYIYPIDNFDEMRERVAETLFSPENISKMGPYWQFENIGSELTSCMAYARSMESYMKLTEHPDLEIPPIQTMREMLLTWEMFQKMGYMLYPDSSEAAERAAIFNAWLDQILATHIQKRGEEPLLYRLPPPRLHNTTPTKHDPDHSLSVKNPGELLHTKNLYDPSIKYKKDEEDGK